MTTPLTTTFGPCQPWPVEWPCETSGDDAARLPQVIQFATEILWALTGRQFGLCTVTLRPCRRDCYDAGWFGRHGWHEWGSVTYPMPALVGGQWFNLGCGGCPGSCSCATLSETLLPAPVHRVIEVRVDGAVLVTGAYRVDDNRRLVRIDGGEWPSCNNLNLADTEPGTWSVTAEYGQPVPQGGAFAMGALACDLLKSLRGEDCTLSPHVRELVRQGVTIQYPDTTELIRTGLTGNRVVDWFVRTWNPNGLTRRSGTYSVDDTLPRRVNT